MTAPTNEPVEVEPQRSARVAAPPSTAPLSVQSPQSPTRATGKLTLKPPKIAKNYFYWEQRGGGFRLDYRKRNKQKASGFDYLYMGWWATADMLAILTELSPAEAIAVLRAEANRNAQLYLKRKEERDGKRI